MVNNRGLHLIVKPLGLFDSANHGDVKTDDDHHDDNEGDGKEWIKDAGHEH